jgi:hypothetical protein
MRIIDELIVTLVAFAASVHKGRLSKAFVEKNDGIRQEYVRSQREHFPTGL